MEVIDFSHDKTGNQSSIDPLYFTLFSSVLNDTTDSNPKRTTTQGHYGEKRTDRLVRTDWITVNQRFSLSVILTDSQILEVKKESRVLGNTNDMYRHVSTKNRR